MAIFSPKVLRALTSISWIRSLPVFRSALKNPELLCHLSDASWRGPHEPLKLMQYVMGSARKPGRDIIDLSLGAPRFGEDWAKVVDQCKNEEIVHAGDLDYPTPQGLTRLREGISQKYLREKSWTYQPETEILVCNGANQALGLIFESFVSPGDAVVLFDPSYMVYRYKAMICRADIRWVNSTVDESGVLQFSESELNRALSGARIMFMSSPVNPSSAVIDPERLQLIRLMARAKGVLLVMDDVYEDFVREEKSRIFNNSLRPVGSEIVINSFSKSFGAAALRVGYVLASESVIQVLRMHMISTCPFVNALGQRVATRFLTGEFEALARPYRQQVLLQGFDGYKALREAKISVSFPAGAMYLWVDGRTLGVKDGNIAAKHLAEEFGVASMPGSCFGPSSLHFLRLSSGGPKDKFNRGIQALIEMRERHVRI